MGIAARVARVVKMSQPMIEWVPFLCPPKSLLVRVDAVWVMGPRLFETVVPEWSRSGRSAAPPVAIQVVIHPVGVVARLGMVTAAREPMASPVIAWERPSMITLRL